MTVVFKAKTQEGYTVKILSELLQNIIMIACLKITKEGIFLRMTDSQMCILTDIELLRNNFNIYQMNTEDMFIGLNLGHLFKMLKSVKKKDSLVIYIDDETPDRLFLVVNPKENNRVSTSSVCIQHTQNISIPLPTGYQNPIIIPSNEYQRTLKDMNNISKTLSFNVRQYSLIMTCTADNIFSRDVLFGELDDDTDIKYADEFDIEYFIRTIKIAGLDKLLHVYGGPKHLPLCITTNIGQLGKLSIYIKSQKQIKNSTSQL